MACLFYFISLFAMIWKVFLLGFGGRKVMESVVFIGVSGESCVILRKTGEWGFEILQNLTLPIS